MRLLSNRAAVVVVAVVMAASVLAGERAMAADSTHPGFSAIPGSIKPTTDVDMGEFSSPQMGVYVVLAPRNESELSDLLANVYDPKSNGYRHWLGKGEFYSRFAPSDAQVAAVTDYLRASGLVVEQSSSPFLLRASGPSSVVAAAFKTTLRTYRNPKGIDYFSNDSAVQTANKPGLGSSRRCRSLEYRAPATADGASPETASFGFRLQAVRLHTRPRHSYSPQSMTARRFRSVMAAVRDAMV